jgi:pimeloyl-ACP methyl ester carboxylesterase
VTRHLLAATVAFALLGCAKDAAPPADAADNAGFVSARITVTLRGSGPDIILVPGLNSHRDVWAQLADSVEGRYRLHLVQVNGFAGAPPGDNAEGPVSAPVADEIARYITGSKLAKPAVVGHSMGGTIAMMVGARHPDLVGRVMVVDMPPFLGGMFGPPGATAESMRPVADSMRAAMLAAPPGAPTMFEQMAPTMTMVDSMRPRLINGSRGSHPATTANAFHELLVTDLRPELPRIAVPLTVLYVVPPHAPIPGAQIEAAYQSMYGVVPNAQVIRVENSWHFIMWDQPGRMVTELDAFMKR